MRDDSKSYDYVDVTETPDTKGSQEQIGRLYARYRFASEFCVNKDVLEVACGAGLGLGYLARSAKKVVGGDIDETNLKFARQTYENRANVVIQSLDAQDLHFDDKSFDVVILYEALYYLAQPERFIDEARRVLRREGVLIICSANKDWLGFNPSPYSYIYFSVPELHSLLQRKGFAVSMFAECPAQSGNMKGKVISGIKQFAVALNLIPKTMKGKEKLKRIFLGKLSPLPTEVTDGMADYTPPVPIAHNAPVTNYKVIFAVAYVH